MPPERDLFANFERMRREVDELFGDVAGRSMTRRGGFSPRVDVLYAKDPPRAIVQAELAGIDLSDLELQVEGRVLTLSGLRKPPVAEGGVYQQLEIEHGRFHRAIDLGVEVDPDAAAASYHDGILRVELPLLQPESRSRTVPIERGGEDPGS
jgi:HSP20 family protein